MDQPLPCDLVELRLDYMKSIGTDILNDLLQFKEKIILTVRDTDEGGVNHFPDNSRIKFMRSAFEMGFMTDLEARFLKRYPEMKAHIASFHLLKGSLDKNYVAEMMSNLKGRYRFFKIATVPGRENMQILVDFIQSNSNVAAMEIGGNPLDRIAFSILGSRLLYCSLGEATAEGQMKCAVASDILHSIWKPNL